MSPYSRLLHTYALVRLWRSSSTARGGKARGRKQGSVSVRFRLDCSWSTAAYLLALHCLSCRVHSPGALPRIVSKHWRKSNVISLRRPYKLKESSAAQSSGHCCSTEADCESGQSVCSQITAAEKGLRHIPMKDVCTSHIHWCPGCSRNHEIQDCFCSSSSSICSPL